MLVLGFEWDEINVAKLSLHGLRPLDIEMLFDSGNPDIFKHPKDTKRRIALGFVPDERFVLVVFEYDQETRWIRVVTAYEPSSQKWWKIYETAKSQKTKR